MEWPPQTTVAVDWSQPEPAGWALRAVNDSQKSGLSKLFGAREVIIEYHVMGLIGFNLQCWMLVLLWFNCNCPGSSLLEYEICSLLLILQKPQLRYFGFLKRGWVFWRAWTCTVLKFLKIFYFSWFFVNSTSFILIPFILLSLQASLCPCNLSPK